MRLPAQHPRPHPVFPALTLALLALLSAPSHLSAQDAPPAAGGDGSAKPAALADPVVAGQTGTAAKSGTPEQRAAAEELLKVSAVEKLMTDSFENALENQSHQLDGMDIPDDQKAKFMEMQKRSSEIIKTELSWEKIKEDVISSYVETYTPEEIKGLIEFYKTDLGKKLVEKQNMLMDKTMQIAQARMDALRPRMAALAAEIIGPMPGGPGAGGPPMDGAPTPPPAPTAP